MANDPSYLIIDAYQGSRPASAHCLKCGGTFRSLPSMTTLEANSAIQSDFDAHKCEKLDVDEAVNRIVREGSH